MGTYDQLKKKIVDGGGVATTTLGELREAIKAARLGPYVLKEIAEKLHQEGIEFFPAQVVVDNSAPRQHQEVRLIHRDPNSPIYRAMHAIDDPTEDGDDFLRRLAADSAAARLAQQEHRLDRVRGALQDALAALDEPADADV